MVNNNNLISKTETIYELKNEIPTYEEFMKTYKSDERINASYESEINSYGELEKGYGPCRICGQSTTWIDLYIACPAIGCDDNVPGYWRHSIDDYRTQISNKARIRCSKSNCSEDHMSKWRFGCSRHKGEYYRSVNINSFDRSLSIALGASSVNPVMRDLVKYIAAHEEQWE